MRASASGPVRGIQGRLSLFQRDRFNRLQSFVIRRRPGALSILLRIFVLILFGWFPLFFGAWASGNLDNGQWRESLLLDFACWAQFWGFIPLSVVAESFIEGRMRESVPHLSQLLRDRNLASLVDQLTVDARRRIPDLICLVLAYVFSLLWAVDEVSNGIASWHTSLEGGEHFTFAGWWAALVGLPLFTYLWLRWVWRIAAWTRFLYRLSKHRLKLMATHPDRTGGLGALSDVQTSFAIIIFGTGVLFSVAMGYKIYYEGTPFWNYTVWAPIVGYILLAPTVFLAPLFLFTRSLSRVRRQTLKRLTGAVAAYSRRLEEDLKGATQEDRLRQAEIGSYEELASIYQCVRQMRVVPFDARSVAELVTSSAAPFAPLLLAAELPDKARAILELIT